MCAVRPAACSAARPLPHSGADSGEFAEPFGDEGGDTLLAIGEDRGSAWGGAGLKQGVAAGGNPVGDRFPVPEQERGEEVAGALLGVAGYE